MKLIFLIIIFAVADRAFPAVMFGYLVITYDRDRHELPDQREILRKYGWVGFPRTLFAVSACATAAAGLFFPLSQDLQGLVAVIFAALFGISAMVDFFKAMKPEKKQTAIALDRYSAPVRRPKIKAIRTPTTPINPQPGMASAE
jgi:hypothetical protein